MGQVSGMEKKGRIGIEMARNNYKKSYKPSKKAGAKEKGKTGLMWAGGLSILYYAWQYVGVWPYLLFGLDGLGLAFPELEVPMEYIVILAQIFVGCAVLVLGAKYVWGIKKKDVENA